MRSPNKETSSSADTQRELVGDFPSCQTLGWPILSRTRHRAIKTAMINVSTIDIKHWPWPRVEIAEGQPGQLEKLEPWRWPTGGCNYWWIIYCQHCPLPQGWLVFCLENVCSQWHRLDERAVGAELQIAVLEPGVIESCSFAPIGIYRSPDFAIYGSQLSGVCVRIISIQYIQYIRYCIDALIARNHLSYK